MSNLRNRALVFDESGNLGVQGRYFVICCIDTCEPKTLHNVMKRKLYDAKLLFPNMKHDVYEIKAVNAYPCVKYHVLESIVKQNISISYVVADLQYVYQRLLDDKNLFYNYLLKILIDEIIPNNYKSKPLNLALDNKTVKVKSENSFEDYIKIHLNYERFLDLDINVEYIDSKAKVGFIVQAADYVANAVYSYYEYGTDLFYNIIKNKTKVIELFPRNKFGS